MWSSEFGCKIQRSGSPGSYTYSVAEDRANRPVNCVNWGNAARFMNWLHNRQPTGAQGLNTTEDGAYYLNGATSDAELMLVTRRNDAKYWIPTENEWYKAAYHQNDGTTGNYFDYPTSSDSEPSNQIISPDPGNSANYFIFNGEVYTIGEPYWMTEVGEFENSASPYGTFDQGGNVWEWNETAVTDASRLARGGGWNADSYYLRALHRDGGHPTFDGAQVGFRVASVPEPSSITLMLCAGAMAVVLWWRRRKYHPSPRPH
jgi:formylglycine-generating enzyme